jgi:membrane associated rhomboid family serine protease
MFPLRDSAPSGTYPVVTVSIIAVNAIIWIYELSLGLGLDRFISIYGLTPVKFLLSYKLPGGLLHNAIIPMFTSIFLHAGWMHIIGNMWFLWIFGDNVEDRLGRFNYFVFYILSGLGASLIQVIVHPASNIPIVGASGCISGVLGAYLLSFPQARIHTLLIIFVIIRFVEIPAFLFLILWFVFQFISGAAEFGNAESGGVAYWAHMGGFVVGMALLVVMPKKKPRRPWVRNNRSFF